MCAVLLESEAFAQNYNQLIAFGDSTIDSGWFANAKLAPGTSNPFDTYVANAVAAGGNAHFTGPGPNYSQILAGFFGLTANAANTPGGTNYAIGGSFVSGGPSVLGASAYTNFMLEYNSLPVNPALPGATGQIANYLASVGGRANPNALYLISTGGNDFIISSLSLTPSQTTTYYNFEAAVLATSVAGLQNAGARYIIVTNEGGGAIEDLIWKDLAAAGVRFIPSDTAEVAVFVGSHLAEFGFTALGDACKPPPGFPATPGYAYGPTCVPTTTPSANYGYLVSANALQTHSLLDGTHTTEAYQQIVAGYNYSLLTAPSEISFLAETAVKSRLGLVSTIQDQIELSNSHRGPSGVNAWVTGDVTSVSLDNYRGFPGDPDTVVTGTVGVDYAARPGFIAGFALSTGSLTSALGAYGSFRQDESTASFYAAYKAGALWANVIGTYGHLNYDVNRNVPIGITIQTNTGSTSGDNWSAAFQGGWKFWNDGFTHGPVAGFVYQNVGVAGFTESGSFTSLGFDSQIRESDVGQFGYKIAYDWVEYQPFVQLTWNHEFADTNRNVIASLTTTIAPSYSLPAVLLGKDWGEIKGGVTIDVGSGVKVLAIGSGDFSQTRATVYGGQIGFNIAF
jgi:outer membrane lipase/esterase